MGTTAEKLQAIVTAKADIGAAITEKGGTVPQKLSEYGNAIRALPSGAAAPLAPVDAKKLYAAMRDPTWPPMPEDVPEHTIVFLYSGGVSADFTVTCEGQYTVERKLCTNVDGVWSYTVESTESFDSGTQYKVDGTHVGSTKRLLTVSASSITNFSLGSTIQKMQGCVELICSLPGMPPPRFGGMKDLKFATMLGKAAEGSAASLFNGCTSLICVIASDLNITGNISSAFRDCENLMAVDISLDPSFSHSRSTYMFANCSKLTTIPAVVPLPLDTVTYAFQNCFSLKEAVVKGDDGKFSAGYCFNGCVSLEKVTFTGNYTIANLSTAFGNCISLRHLIFDLPNWTGGTISIENCAFEREGLVEMFRSLPTATGTANTITITGNPGVADLTEEDKAIATDKNWTLVL